MNMLNASNIDWGKFSVSQLIKIMCTCKPVYNISNSLLLFFSFWTVQAGSLGPTRKVFKVIFCANSCEPTVPQTAE